MPAAFGRASTDNIMMGLEDLAAFSSTMGLERHRYREMIEKVTAEIEAGVFMHHDVAV